MSADEKLEEASAFAKEVKATFPVVHDVESKIFDQYEVEGIPANVIIGRNGKVVESIEGADLKALKAAVQKALSAR